jgi:hypothetical protein
LRSLSITTQNSGTVTQAAGTPDPIIDGGCF